MRRVAHIVCLCVCVYLCMLTTQNAEWKMRIPAYEGATMSGVIERETLSLSPLHMCIMRCVQRERTMLQRRRVAQNEPSIRKMEKIKRIHFPRLAFGISGLKISFLTTTKKSSFFFSIYTLQN